MTFESPPALMVGWCLSNAAVTVVGGGVVAERRVHALLQADARVKLIAPTLSNTLQQLAHTRRVHWRGRRAKPEDIVGQRALVVAIDDSIAARHLASLARDQGVLVHVADDPEWCDFVFPAVYQEGDLTIGVASNGRAPALAARLRDHLARALPPGAAAAVTRFGELRDNVRRAWPGKQQMQRRMTWLTKVAKAMSWAELATLPKERNGAPNPLRITDVDPDLPVRSEREGSVTLVGAGPGDPDLLTVAAHRAVRDADLVLADRLVSPEILSLVQGRLFVARKLPGAADHAQAELEDLMVEGAQRGLRVVRLKNGDPMVFGRAGEELDRLTHAGIPATVVPGVSSVLAAPGLAALPLTQRGISQRIVISPGHAANDGPLSVPRFEPKTTFVFLMAVRNLPRLLQALLEQGFPGEAPAALLSDASLPNSQTIQAPVQSLLEAARDHQVCPPAVLVIGDVVLALANQKSNQPSHSESMNRHQETPFLGSPTDSSSQRDLFPRKAMVS